MMAEIRCAGVTSNAGLYTVMSFGAVRRPNPMEIHLISSHSSCTGSRVWSNKITLDFESPHLSGAKCKRQWG